MTLCEWADLIVVIGIGILVLAVVAAFIVLNILTYGDRLRNGLICSAITLFLAVLVAAAHISVSEKCNEPQVTETEKP